MALNIKNSRVEKLATEVATMAGESKTEAIRRALELRKEKLAMQSEAQMIGRHDELMEFLEQEIWPLVPEGARGKRLSKSAREKILGYGPEGI